MKYRSLTDEEIMQLEDQNCRASDWTTIYVSYDFSAHDIRRVKFDGEIYIGDRVTMEDVGIVRTTEGATYGEGTPVSVLNEAGDENIILFSGLTSQLAALMVHHCNDKQFMTALRGLIADRVREQMPSGTTIGSGVTISNCRELTNVNIGDDCELYGVSRMVDCTLCSTTEASIYVGDDVICDNVIILAGSSISDGARLYNSFVGEACHVGRGFTSEASLFFANSHADNGEACAALCGPYSVTHHKASLLIGGEYSFYNAGSATNFSNHAYKMGPIHYGTLSRGTKTASGSHILWPARIGAFSMVMGKVENHPDTMALPFSYIISSNGSTYIVPGRNLATVGTYRDIMKWPKRDRRANDVRRSHICFDWLSPYSIEQVLKGRQELQNLLREQGENAASYNFGTSVIKNSALKKGLKAYDLAIRMYMGAAMEKHGTNHLLPSSSIGAGHWVDLLGEMLPESEELQIIDDVCTGTANKLIDVEKALDKAYDKYEDYAWTWAYSAICDYYGLEQLTETDTERIINDGKQAHEEWLRAIRNDAEREFQLGDVSDEALADFIASTK